MAMSIRQFIQKWLLAGLIWAASLSAQAYCFHNDSLSNHPLEVKQLDHNKFFAGIKNVFDQGCSVFDRELVSVRDCEELRLSFAAFAGPAQSLSIVVVDDDEMVLTASAQLLGDWAHKVRIFNSAESCMQAMTQEEHVHLFLVDADLGRSDEGFELIESLRALWFASASFFIVTGDASEAKRTQAAEQGVTLLLKPLDGGRLRSVLLSVAV